MKTSSDKRKTATPRIPDTLHAACNQKVRSEPLTCK